MLDLQSLLAEAVQRLRDETGAEAAVAWALREDGAPYVAAASFDGAPPAAPRTDDFAALAALPGATDLASRDADPPLRALARRFGCGAAAPVAATGGELLAVLLLRAAERRAVAPRALGSLDAAAARLASPLAAALAHGRLRALDERVRGLDRLATLGALCTEIAHEVRNPLVSMKTFLQLLPERRGDPEFLDHFWEVVMEEVARMERLLDVVLAHGGAQRDAGAQPPAAVGDVLASAAELLRHRALQRDVRLEISARDRLPRVALGEDRLRQVVLNLALNAIDATPSGGRVRLCARGRGGAVELRVIDEGPGVPRDRRDAVFEPFFSTRPGPAAGLGLAITRRIVEEAGGEIRVGDAPAGGAEFRLLLPSGD